MAQPPSTIELAWKWCVGDFFVYIWFCTREHMYRHAAATSTTVGCRVFVVADVLLAGKRIRILLSFRWGPRWGDEGVRMSELWRIAALFSSPLLLSAGSNARAVRWLVRYRNRITAFCYANTHRHRQILLDNACTENTNTESRTYGAVWSCVDRGAHRYPGHRRSVFRHRAALPGTEHIHIIAMLWKLRND